MKCPDCNSENIIKKGFVKDKQRYMCNECKRTFTESTAVTDYEIVAENVKLAKKAQSQQDFNRIERKAFREYARIENALTEYTKELVSVLKEKSFTISTVSHKEKKNSVCLVVQISDAHLNELVEIQGNSYNFEVASKRLKKFANKIHEYSKSFNISKIVLALTGDILNSDRRLDEMLSKATNRAKASFLAVELIQQFIVDLNRIANIDIVSITGNESRINDEMGFTAEVASDNYDFIIYNILKIIFKNKKGINFINSDPTEAVIKIGDLNLLITHGYDAPESGTQKFIQQMVGRYAQKGILISYVIYGHLHAAFLSDLFSRSSSLVGSNTYNEYDLNLFSKASQNIYIFRGKDIDAIKIDLQNVCGIEGYKFEDLGDIYNTKSESKVKANKKKVVFEVVI